MEIRQAAPAAARLTPRTPRGALRAALLVVGGALFFAASLAGYLLVAVTGVLALRLLWSGAGRGWSGAPGGGRRPAAPPPARQGAGPRLRLVRTADGAA